jgi:hypothetical protein
VTALREVRRVVRAGPVVLTAFTRENLRSLFVYEYFGLSEPITARPPAHAMEAHLREAGFGSVEYSTYVYTDTVDGSLNALHTDPALLADPAHLRNTSLWHRLDEATRRKGVEALGRDLRSGVLQERVGVSRGLAEQAGHGTAFAAWP